MTARLNGLGITGHVLRILVVLMLLVPAIGYGGTPSWVQNWIALYAFLMLILVGSHAAVAGHSLIGRQLWVPLGLLVLWAVWIGIQCLPLPLEMLRVVAPERARQVDGLSVLEGWKQIPIQRAVLTSDLLATQRRLLLTLALIALFVCAAWVSRVRTGRLWLLGMLLVAGSLQAALGSYEALVNSPTDIFGNAKHYRGFATGTFVNRNHFAGYLELSIVAAFAVAALYLSGPRMRMTGPMGGRPPSTRDRIRLFLRSFDSPVLLLCLFPLLMLSGLLLSQSRMGNFAVAFALAAGAMLFIFSADTRQRKPLMTLLAVLLTAMTVFVLIGQSQGLFERYEETRVTEDLRWKIWPDLRTLIEHYGFTGAGLGSFASVFPAYREVVLPRYYDHAHNDYAQFWIEAGIVGGMFLVGFVVLSFIRAWRGFRQQKSRSVRAIHITALMAMLAVAIHSLADFNLQIPSNAIVLLMLMGGSWGCPARNSKGLREAADQ